MKSKKYDMNLSWEWVVGYLMMMSISDCSVRGLGKKERRQRRRKKLRVERYTANWNTSQMHSLQFYRYH
jgi:hypothetical protein